MSFNFSSSADSDLFMSLKGLVNKNQGFFKTAKQAQFLYKQYSTSNINTADEAMRFFGVPLVEGQICVKVTAHTQWADYGSRSIIPVMWAFVVDPMGVAAHYKIGGSGNLRDGWGPEPSKTKLLWSRAADAVCPWSFPSPAEVVASQEPAKSNDWLGMPGDKIEVELKFVRCRDLGYSRFGEMFISVFEDSNGNVVNVWKYFDLEAGASMKVKGTIKSTDDYKGRKQTTLIRIKQIA
jgi:hypothetical protein